MKTIGIIGLGWLGLELGKKLNELNFRIVGTTSSLSKSLEIEGEFDQVISYQLGNPLNSLIFKGKVDVFVITIPPSSSATYSSELGNMLQFLIKYYPDVKLIYTSSISVYGSAPREIDESSSINPETESARKIVDFERILLERYSESSAIIRLAGLVGGTRHPVYFLSGKTGIKKPEARVNLIHREDVIRFISLLIQQFQGGVFNLASPEHPNKREYYSRIAEEKRLAPVIFDEEDIKLDKVVNCIAVKKMNFEFKYNSPYDFPISD